MLAQICQCWSAACPLCPGISDINLFSYREGIIDLDAKVSNGAFDLGTMQWRNFMRSTRDVGGSGTLFYLDYFALKFVARAELHGLAAKRPQ